MVSAVAARVGRTVVALIALAGLVLSVAIVFRDPMAAAMFGLACGWTLVACVQSFLEAAEGRRFIGSDLYLRSIEPYVVRPTIRATRALGHGAERLLKALVGLFTFSLWAVLFLIVVGLLVLLGVVIFHGVATIPVSVAVIVGAIIIAGAISKR